MTSTRTIATVTGWLFLITFITSIPAAFVFYPPVLTDPTYIISAGADMACRWGRSSKSSWWSPISAPPSCSIRSLKRQNPIVALGYVTARVMEGAMIAVGILSLLSVVTLRQDFAGTAGADAAALVPIGSALVAVHDSTFLLGPGFLAPLGNGILLGSLMYRSGLVPRRMAMLGLIGGPLLIVAFVGVLFGVYEQVSLPAAIATIPEFLWELSLGIYLVVKGFQRSPITAAYERDVERNAVAV